MFVLRKPPLQQLYQLKSYYVFLQKLSKQESGITKNNYGMYFLHSCKSCVKYYTYVKLRSYGELRNKFTYVTSASSVDTKYHTKDPISFLLVLSVYLKYIRY